MSTTEENAELDLRQRFKGCEYPEHVEQALKPILKIAQDEVDLTDEEWEEVLSTLRTEIEFGEATWTN